MKALRRTDRAEASGTLKLWEPHRSTSVTLPTREVSEGLVALISSIGMWARLAAGAVVAKTGFASGDCKCRLVSTSDKVDSDGRKLPA